MIKSIKVTGKAPSVSATAEVEFTDAATNEVTKTTHTMKGNDLQTALSMLKDEVCVTGKDYQYFDAATVDIIKAEKAATGGDPWPEVKAGEPGYVDAKHIDYVSGSLGRA